MALRFFRMACLSLLAEDMADAAATEVDGIGGTGGAKETAAAATEEDAAGGVEDAAGGAEKATGNGAAAAAAAVETAAAAAFLSFLFNSFR